MPMLCLAGTFPVSGTEPDGDSVRFRPDDPDAASLRQALLAAGLLG